MNYEETTNYMFNCLPMFHRVGAAAYKANLDNTLALDEYFGHPHKKFKTIHVAGTNGKGSVSHIIASVLQSAGYKTGLYTSPHLTDFRERIKINGEMISKDEVVDFVAKYKPIFDKLQPSFFEMATAMAFDYFARQNIDVAVVEVGLGGRLDCTNIISPLVSVITNIGFDHMQFLGNTIAEIAGEKAGIIKPKTPVVIGEWHNESAPVFEQKAKAENAEIFFAEKCLKITNVEHFGTYQKFTFSALRNNFEQFNNAKIDIDLLGDYQQKNAVTALAAIAVLQNKNLLKISNDNVYEGFACAAKQTGLRGRWQTLSQKPLTVCDTGHNSHGLRLSMAQLKHTAYKKLYFVFGMVGDKDIEAVIPLLPRDAHYIYTNAAIPRALPADKLAALCTAAGLQGEIVVGVKQALQRARQLAAPDDMIFIGGSTYVVAEII